jgi:glycosyltransferase involved in cell wall biosynthesis
MKHHVLLIGLVWPEPNSSAAGVRMLQIIESFLKQEYIVSFACSAAQGEFSYPLENLGVNCYSIVLNSSCFDTFIQELAPTMVVFDRYITEEHYGWRVSENCPNALRILDSEDLHCLRKARQKAVNEQRVFSLDDLMVEETAKREIASILRCDLSLMVSKYEMELLQSQFKISKDILYYLPIFANKLDAIPTYSERDDFVFIGNFLHEPNWDCVKYLANCIWPLLHSKLPKTKLLVYGAYAAQKVLELHKPQQNLFILGRAENAEKVVKKAKVVLAPIRFGAGIKGKLIEAMQCGTPSVSTSIGAEAINDGLNWNGFIRDNPIEFVDAAVSLYQEENIWIQSQKNGFEILEKRFNKSSFNMDFMDVVNSLLENIKQHRNENFIGSILQHHSVSSTKYMSKWIEEKNKNN